MRDVIRLFMDHHTWKIAQTEAARLADPNYQKEASSVSVLKAAALGVSATGDVPVAVVVVVVAMLEP